LNGFVIQQKNKSDVVLPLFKKRPSDGG
jgi:hypothetical protein